MNSMHASDDADIVDDLSTLSWVHDELRKSLDLAHKSLRRTLKEAQARSGSDVDAADPAVLRTARAHLHQGVGALEMIGLSGPARVLRASESALSRLIAKPRLLNAAAVETIESASFGVLDYLSRKLAGKGLPSLALFPQFKCAAGTGRRRSRAPGRPVARGLAVAGSAGRPQRRPAARRRVGARRAWKRRCWHRCAPATARRSAA